MAFLGFVKRLLPNGFELVPEMAFLARRLTMDDETILLARLAPDHALLIHRQYAPFLVPPRAMIGAPTYRFLKVGS